MRGRSEKEVAANQFFEICRVPAKEGKRDTDRARGARRSERERARCSAVIAQRVRFGSSHGLKWVETNWLNSNLQRESKNLDRLAKRNKTDGFPALWLKPYGSKQRTAPDPEKVMEMLVFCILSLYWAEMSRKIVPPGFWHTLLALWQHSCTCSWPDTCLSSSCVYPDQAAAGCLLPLLYE